MSEPRDGPADARLTGPESRGGGFYGYDRYRIALDGHEFERDVLRVGRVAVILPVDAARDEVVLLRQFRLGAHLATGLGDVVEVPAGRVERGEDVVAAAQRECVEETGVVPEKLVPMFDLWPSPGSSDEHMFFFLAAVDASNVPERAGLAADHEHTRPFRLSIDDALAALAAGQLHYGAGVAALQWLAINRGRLGELLGGPIVTGT